MSKQKILLLLVLFLLGVGGVVLYQSLRAGNARNQNTVITPPLAQECDQFTTTQDCKPISLATSTWKVFENTNYSYAISYPSEGYVNSRDDYGGEEEIYFGIRGRFTLGGVDATLYPNRPPSEVPPKEIDLKSYAEAVRMLQINYLNPNHKNRNIGALKETIVAGRKAYQFTLDQGFSTEKRIGAGYAIPPGQTYVYNITENPKGQKIMIYYFLGNPIAETMYKTFVFK